MSKRPYIQSNIEELKKQVDSNWDNTNILEEILDELSFRTTRKATKLREDVTDRLKKLSVSSKSPAKSAKKAGKTSSSKQPSKAQAAIPVPNKNQSKREISLPKSVLLKIENDNKGHASGPAKDEAGEIASRSSFNRPILKLLSAPYQSHQPQRRKYDSNNGADLPFEETDDIVQNFIQILGFHIEELKTQGNITIITLEGGVKFFQIGGDIHYRFPFTDDVNLAEGSSVQIYIGGQQAFAQVVAIAGGNISLSTEEDFGEAIEAAQIKVDNSYLFVKLKDELEGIAKGDKSFGLDCAKKVLGKEVLNVSIDEATFVPGKKGLNEKQLQAVQTALGSEVTYLWGPPGTGKTGTLSKLINAYYKQGKRVLIVSNTNLAIDTLLEKVCDDLKSEKDEGFNAGSVIRSGKPHKQELLVKYENFVVLSKVVQRLSTALTQEKDSLEQDISSLKTQVAPYRKIILDFEQLELIQKQYESAKKEFHNLKTLMESHKNELSLLDNQYRKLEADLIKAQESNAFKRFIGGLNPEKLKEQMELNRYQKSEKEEKLSELLQSFEQHQQNINENEKRYKALNIRISGKNKAKTLETIKHLEAKFQPLEERLTEVNRQLEQVEAEVLANSKIMAATATQTFLKPKDFSKFDAVIIDEASMLTLPTVFYVAGLGQQHVVIAGDFLQLEPIVSTKSAIIKEWIGTDVFTKAGIVEKVDAKADIPQLVKLDTQYRMDSRICSLINQPFYKDLKTGRSDGPRDNKGEQFPPAPFAGPLTIIDTSSLWPFVNKKNGKTSRYNVLHAVAIRNLCYHLKKNGFIKDHHSVGIGTPYTAQADFISKICRELDLDEITIGTIHRLQGDEKDMVIVDIADSIGVPGVSLFCQANQKHENGAKLFNVAFSRPKNHLVVFANLTYLEENLPTDSLLRVMLYEMQCGAEIIDVKDVLSLGPDKYDISSLYNYGLPKDFNINEAGMFNQKTFETAFYRDMESAKSSIVIFSAFATLNRISRYSDIFRKKIQGGVKVRCITRAPAYQGSISPENVQQGLTVLDDLGVIVDLRNQMHEKVAIIDGKILWFGSLNPLSHTENTDEMMLRIESQEGCRNISKMIAARKTAAMQNEEFIQSIAQRENPICPKCSSLSVYFSEAKYGPFFCCLDKEGCKWTESIDAPKRKTDKNNNIDLTEFQEEAERQTCSDCGKAMVVRENRWGKPFLACTGYPKCKKTMTIGKK